MASSTALADDETEAALSRGRGLVLTLLCGAALLLALLWIGQRRLIYFPLGDMPAPTAVGLPRAQVVSLSTDDGVKLGAWVLPAAVRETRVTEGAVSGNA